MRRLPPQTVERDLSNLIELVSEHASPPSLPFIFFLLLPSPPSSCDVAVFLMC